MVDPDAPSAPESQRLDPAEAERLLHWQANIVPPQPPPQSEVEEALKQALPDDVALEVLRLARPAIGLWPQRPDTPRALSVSHLGGMPRVPQHFVWPMEEGEPLWFLAAISCEELGGFPGSEQLPSSGMLAFFADANGVTAMDFGCGHVCHWQDVDDLVAATPEPAPTEILPLASIAFRPLLDLPDQWSTALAPFLGDRELRERYAGVKRSLRNRGIPEDEAYYCGFSKLLGWPSLVQWHDLDTGGAKDASLDIRLLLQLDVYPNGVERADWGGTGGSLYFTIPNVDLVAGHLAKCEFERQFT